MGESGGPGRERLGGKGRCCRLVSGWSKCWGIAVVSGGCVRRIERGGGNGASSEVTAMLPKWAKVIATAVADDRIAVTIEQGGMVEVRTFDLKTLRPTGRLRFATEP